MVKDLIDVAGVPTTAGSRALATTAAAELDAPCLAGARAAGARIVGKTNLSELAYGASGVNEYSAHRSIRSIPAGFPADHRADRRSRWPAARQISLTAPIPAARSGSRPRSAASPG